MVLNKKLSRAYSEELKRIVQDAAQMKAGYFMFDGVWDMEPFKSPLCNKHLEWNVKYDGDIESTYMLVRMGYLYKFILAYECTEDISYINCGKNIINKWIHDNSKFLIKDWGKLLGKVFCKNVHGHRSLDVGIMCVNVTDYILYCKENGLITDKEFSKLKKHLTRAVLAIYRGNSDYYKSFSNWGAIENAGAYYTIRQLGLNANSEIAIDRLERQLNNQIDTAGSQIESSTLYLCEVVLASLKVARFFPDVRQKLKDILTSSCQYLYSISDLNNEVPNIGDSDRTNISDIMSIAGATLSKEFGNYVNRKVNLEFVLKYDLYNLPEGIDNRCDTLKKYKYQYVERDLKNGFYIFCSNYPRIVSGHKHYDYMSFICQIESRDFLIDCGRYTYVGGEDRRYFVGPKAHNTIVINGDAYYGYVDSWTVRQHIECDPVKVIYGDSYKTVFMKCCYGYGDVTVTRCITYVYAVGLIITDIIDGSDFNSYEAFFNLAPEIKINEATNELILPDNLQVSFYTDELQYSIKEGKYSPKYNISERIHRIEIQSERRELTHMFIKPGWVVDVRYNEKSANYEITGAKESFHVVVQRD